MKKITTVNRSFNGINSKFLLKNKLSIFPLVKCILPANPDFNTYIQILISNDTDKSLTVQNLLKLIGKGESDEK